MLLVKLKVAIFHPSTFINVTLIAHMKLIPETCKLNSMVIYINKSWDRIKEPEPIVKVSILFSSAGGI